MCVMLRHHKICKTTFPAYVYTCRCTYIRQTKLNKINNCSKKHFFLLFHCLGKVSPADNKLSRFLKICMWTVRTKTAIKSYLLNDFNVITILLPYSWTKIFIFNNNVDLLVLKKQIGGDKAVLERIHEITLSMIFFIYLYGTTCCLR